MDIKEGVDVLGHRVLIKPLFQSEVTDWGFKLDVGEGHKREKAAASIGTIVSIGPNAWVGFDDGKPWAEVGDTVHFAKYGGKFITYNDEEYVIVNDEDVQLRIRKED
jgi:co-chaperonin GroES (HSP10)